MRFVKKIGILLRRDMLTSLDWTPGVSKFKGRKNVSAGFRSFSL